MVRRIWWLLLWALVMTQSAGAAEIRVLATGAMRQILRELAPEFTRESGVAVVFKIGTAGETTARVMAGEAADLVVVPAARLDALEKSGVVVAGSRVDMARASLGLVVREDATAPDISTPDAFKRALVAARSVAYTNPAAGGTAGLYVAELLRRLGIAEEIGNKAVLARGGRDAAERVARGEAEFGITFVSEILPVKGAKLAALLPEALQLHTIYVAVLVAKGSATGEARAFVEFVTGRTADARWRAVGLEPIGAR